MKSSNSITTLPESPDQDRRFRFRRYVWQMATRVVLFIAAVVVWSVWHTWLFVVPIALAAIIPWVAVIIANAGNRNGNELVAPGGAVAVYQHVDPRLREQREDDRDRAYRDEQERLRQQAESAQSEWQRSGDHTKVWGRR